MLAEQLKTETLFCPEKKKSKANCPDLSVNNGFFIYTLVIKRVDNES